MNKDSNPAISKPSEVGAPDLTEIEITPAMIEAGLEWLYAFSRDYRPFELVAEIGEELDEVGLLIAAQGVGDQVEDDFGVPLAGEVVVGVRPDFGPEFLDVGEVAVEREGEPLPFAAVPALEGLGVAPPRRPAGGVADVADAGPPREVFHDRRVLVLVRHPESLGDGAEFFEGVEELVAFGVEAAEAGGELAAVLEVEEHPRHQAGGLVGIPLPDVALAAVGEVIEGRDSALVPQFVHGQGCPWERGRVRKAVS